MEDLERIYRYLEISGFPAVVCDADGLICFANQAKSELCGFEVAKMIGQSPGRMLQGEETDRETVARVRLQLARGVPFEFSITNYREDRRKYHAGIFVIPFVEGERSQPAYVGISRKLESVDESAVGSAPPSFGRMISEVLELINAG